MEGSKDQGTTKPESQLQPPSPVPSQHQASLPNTTEMPLRQNAHAKLEHHPAAAPPTPLGLPLAYRSLYLHFFLSLHLLAALQPPRLSYSSTSPCLGQFLKNPLCFLLFLTAPVIPDAACRASSADIEATSLALKLSPSVLLDFHSLLDCFF